MHRPTEKQQTNIKNKVVLTTLFTVSIALICVSWSLFFYFHNLLRESIFTQQFTLVSEIADQLNGRIQLARQQLSLAATELNSQVLADPEKLEHALGHVSAISMIFDAGFMVIGTDGRVIAEDIGLPAIVGMDLRFRDYVKVPLQSGKPFLSAPFRSSLPPHNPMIAMAVPVRDNDDRIICLLVGYHSLGDGQFLTSLSSKVLGNSGYLFLLHGRTIIMHPDSTRILETIAEGKNRGIDQALKGMEGSLDNVNSRGKHMFSSFKRVGETGWILAANIPYDDAFSPLKKLAINAVLIAAAGIVFSLLVVWYVTRRLTRPIQELITHVDGVCRAGGEWKPLELKTGDELERLADAFNGMMDQIQQAEKALEQSTETYRIVAEFTAEVAFWREPGGSTRYISPNCLELTGYCDAEFYAEADLLDRIVHPGFREKWSQHRHERDDVTDPLRHTELKIVRKDGQERWVTHLRHEVCSERGGYLGVRGNFTDITLIRRMQAEMRYQKAFAEELINKAAVPIFVLDAAHRILVWNSAMEDLTGLGAAEMLGTTRQWEPFYQDRRPVLADIILSGDEVLLDQYYSSFRHSQHVPGGVQSEGWFNNINGQRRYLFFDAAPVHGNNNRKTAAIETMLDITERKLAEEEQRILSWAIDNNPNSIVITDPDGMIEYVNHKFCTLTGYSTAEAIGQNPRVLKSGEMPPEQYAELWRTISHGGNWHGEFHNKKKNGELYWESASIAPITDEQGRILRYLAVKEDITHRKIYEAELVNNTEELLLKHSELNAMFSLVQTGKREWEDTMDSIPEMVLMCDPTGAITRCNRAVTTFTGLSYNQTLGLNCLELFVRSGMEIISCDDNSGQMVYEGGARHFELLFNELKQIGSDDVRGSVVTIHETTEFLRMNENLQKTSAELQLAQAQAFQQEKMASIGELAAGVAHEINNPMGFISSNLNTMGKYMQKLGAFETALIEAVQNSGDKETVALLNDVRAQMKIDFILKDLHTLLEESRDGAERVRCIVRDLKSFSHEDETLCKPFSINECLDSTLNMARNEIKYVADVERDYDPALPLVNGHPQKLNQVFMNLLVNAAHAIEGHGIIRIKTYIEGNDIVVSVSDTGKGIAPENLTRIFEPFFTTKAVGKGTGLGLSISYEIIKNHGGKLTVESEVGTGTTFTVRLPLNNEVCV
jgi:two-component system, NtrC family, sensor kinase